MKDKYWKKISFKLDSTLMLSLCSVIMRVLNYLRYNELKNKIAFDSIFFLLKFKDNNQNQSDEIQQNTPDQQPRLPKLKLKKSMGKFSFLKAKHFCFFPGINIRYEDQL